MTKAELKTQTIQDWFTFEIESTDKSALVPAAPKKIGFLKIAFVWAFYYLKNEWTYDDAIRDMLL